MADKVDINFIPMDFDSVVEHKINVNEFKNGTKLGSYYSGIVTSLFNSGLGEDSVVKILCEIIGNEVRESE